MAAGKPGGIRSAGNWRPTGSERGAATSPGNRNRPAPAAPSAARFTPEVAGVDDDVIKVGPEVGDGGGQQVGGKWTRWNALASTAGFSTPFVGVDVLSRLSTSGCDVLPVPVCLSPSSTCFRFPSSFESGWQCDATSDCNGASACCLFRLLASSVDGCTPRTICCRYLQRKRRWARRQLG